MVSILSDMYIADAFIERGPYEMYGVHPRDSVSIYGPIVAKYGYNMDEFRQSMLYYAQQNDGLQNIYKEVQERLAERKKEYEPAARIEELSKNLWTTRDSMNVDINSAFRKIDFSIVLKKTGVYRLSADVLFFKNDSTQHPRMTVWLATAGSDSLLNKQEVVLSKDSTFKSYGFNMLFADPGFNLLKGYWLDYDTVKVKQVKLSTKQIKARKTKMGDRYQDSVIGHQHLIMRNMGIRYDFEASELAKDTIKTIQERINKKASKKKAETVEPKLASPL